MNTGPEHSKSFWGVNSREAYGMSWKINESGLARLKRHSENGFFIVSAFHREFEFNENMDRADRLGDDIKSAGLGFIQLLGKWVDYDKIMKKENESEEISLFVPYEEIFDVTEFLDLAQRLAYTYEQDGYILYSPVDKKIYHHDREPIAGSFTSKKLNPFTIEKLSDYYSSLGKSGQIGRKYVFEGVRVPSNHISAMCLSNRGLILLT